MVRVIVYKGKSKLDIVREQSFDVGYAISFKTMVEWINSQLPANEEIGQALRSTVTMYPEIAVREIVANMLVHQDFSEKGFPMVEIYTDRIDVSNPGQPIISVERFIDEYNSRNSSLADLMRRLGICEELGSGLDKAVAAIELFQLPPLRFTVQEARTTVTLFAYRKYADLDRQERIYACYQHACLKYVTNDKMTNLTLRERLGIDKQNYPMASRIIRDTLVAGKIKEEKTENQSRNNKGYVPFWALGRYAFNGCTSVTKIISRATTPPACGSQALDDINKWNCTLEVPQGTLSAYQAAEQWKEFFFIQEGEASTGISNTVVQPTSGTPTYHTLDGREVKNPGKGIYIVNGKKVMIK